MNYAKIKYTDISNGPGIRTAVFFSGCTFNCKGCFNEKAQDFNYGSMWNKEIEDEIIEHSKQDIIVGLSILGGEPLQQDLDILDNFLKRFNEEVGKPIWIWTGFEMEAVLAVNGMTKQVLSHAEIVIDGKFDKSKYNHKLLYRGSSNQRIIDMQKTLEENEIVIDKIHKHILK